MSAIVLVGGAALFETGAALIDTLNPDLLHDDPYYVDTLIQLVQIAVLSYQSGYVLHAIMPQTVTASSFAIVGLGAGFCAAAVVALIGLPFVQSYFHDQPDPAEVLGETEGVKVTWSPAPSHERNQTLYLTQLICSVVAFTLTPSPFFLALAAMHYLSFDLVKGRTDLCFAWKGETGAPARYRQMLKYEIEYYVPLFNEIPLLLQWLGGEKANVKCPISGEELEHKQRPTIYTYEGTQVYTDALVKHLKGQQEHLLDNWKWSVNHHVTYHQYGRSDSFTVDVTLPQENKPTCPGDERSLGHMELTGDTPYDGGSWSAPLGYLTWEQETKREAAV